jgi:hypothetical protein
MDKAETYWMQAEQHLYWTGCDTKTYLNVMAHIDYLTHLCYVDKEFASQIYSVPPGKLVSKLLASRVWEKWNLRQEGIDRAKGLGL